VNRDIERDLIPASLLDALPANVALIDHEGIIIAVNEPWRAFASGNGMSGPGAGVGCNYIDICRASTGPDAASAHAAAAGIQAVLAGERENFSLEYPCHSPLQRRWFRLMVSPVLLEGRRGVLATHMDITDRALTEEHLRQTQEGFRELAQQLREERKNLTTARAVARIGIWETDLKTSKVCWSAETYQFFEIDPATVPTHSLFLASVHPQDRDAVDKAFQESILTRGVHTIDHRIVMPDGRIKYLTETWQTIADEQGVPVRAVGTCQDITERETVNQKLRESEAKLRRSQEIFTTAERVASIGSVALDFRTGLWEWSDEAYRIYGLNRDEFCPSVDTFPALIHPDDREALLGAIPRARQGITPEPIEYRIRRPDGSERLLRREAALARGPDGEVQGIVGSLQDITDVRASERERELLQAQLRQSQRLEAVGQMTGGIAHDFNNLLTVILGNADTLERNIPRDSHLFELVELVRMAAERGAELTSRLLAFSRRQPLNPRAIDANDLVQGMDGLLRRVLDEEISLSIVCDPGLWRALVDPSQLENALINLSVNARDAMPQGGQLTIETRNVDADDTLAIEASGDGTETHSVFRGQYVMIAVSDTGTGMSEETRQRAFEPFFTTKDVGRGSGLGLSMVYGFVRQSRGHVHLYSEVGFGTSVKLYLPRAGEDAIAEANAFPQTDVPGGSESILVVEDDALVRRQVMANLKALGYRVKGAVDGVEALEILKAGGEFDLLFTDLVMPRGLNGRQLAEAAARLHPNLPVLFTSGYAGSAIVHHGRLDPGVTLLTKPYNNSELAKKIRFVLDRAGEQKKPLL
jgi:PAS domain S-box-containing protein